LTLDTQLERLHYICEKENLEINSDILKYLINIAEGDLRRSINLLQTISTFDKKLINQNLINDICGIIPERFISELFESARFQKPEIIVKHCDDFLANGYDLKQFNIQFTEFIAANKTLTDEEKSRINFLIMDSEIKLLENSSQNIQLYNLLSNIRSLFSMSIN
jgi:DNA polymerase III gamma/tau subunit